MITRKFQSPVLTALSGDVSTAAIAALRTMCQTKDHVGVCPVPLHGFNSKQVDLFGLELPYKCKKCGKCFSTMKESSKHHARTHRKNIIKRTSVNFVLENFRMVSVSTIIEDK